MIITLRRSTGGAGAVCALLVRRGRRDPKFYRESTFWHTLKRQLNSQFHLDLVKRNMEQDGHLMGDRHTYYLRDRRWRFCILDGNHQIRPVYEDFNRSGHGVYLTVEHWNRNRWSGRLPLTRGSGRKAEEAGS